MFSNLLALLLSSLFLSAASAVPTPEDSKHCAPACCGCDTTRGAKKVETLWGLWMSYLQQPQNFASALSQFTPTASWYIFGENCDDRSCCQQTYNAENGLYWFADRNITTVDFDINMKLNGTIMTENTLFASVQNVSTIAYHFKMWWNPQINCDYKIDYIEAHSYSCPLSNYPSCSSCIE